jgi:hypothetical protein
MAHLFGVVLMLWCAAKWLVVLLFKVLGLGGEQRNQRKRKMCKRERFRLSGEYLLKSCEGLSES